MRNCAITYTITIDFLEVVKLFDIPMKQIIREGDPVQRMVFVVHGRVRRSQALNRGFIGTSMLQPGSFFGDELLSWCLRRTFIDRLPSSSATFVCVESIEAYCLDADQLRYITDHFRY